MGSTRAHYIRRSSCGGGHRNGEASSPSACDSIIGCSSACQESTAVSDASISIATASHHCQGGISQCQAGQGKSTTNLWNPAPSTQESTLPEAKPVQDISCTLCKSAARILFATNAAQPPQMGAMHPTQPLHMHQMQQAQLLQIHAMESGFISSTCRLEPVEDGQGQDGAGTALSPTSSPYSWVACRASIHHEQSSPISAYSTCEVASTTDAIVWGDQLLEGPTLGLAAQGINHERWNPSYQCCDQSCVAPRGLCQQHELSTPTSGLLGGQTWRHRSDSSCHREPCTCLRLHHDTPLHNARVSARDGAVTSSLTVAYTETVTSNHHAARFSEIGVPLSPLSGAEDETLYIGSQCHDATSFMQLSALLDYRRSDQFSASHLGRLVRLVLRASQSNNSHIAFASTQLPSPKLVKGTNIATCIGHFSFSYRCLGLWYYCNAAHSGQYPAQSCCC